MTQVPNLRFNDGKQIPQLGFGVWQVPADEAAQHVTTALEAGYRHVDTAAAYGNEEGVGQAIARSGIPRDELFVTTKLWNSEHGYDSTLAALDQSLSRLGLDHVDLYLIHWPLPSVDKYVQTYQALERAQRDGKITSIGVSNFQPAHLQRLLDEAEVTPAINQVEIHPDFQQTELRREHERLGVLTEAWSPLGQGKGLLEKQELADVAAKHGKSPAQVVLRWHLQLGNVVIPKSVTPERIKQNIEVFDFELSDEDIAAINGLEAGNRIGPNPDTMDFAGPLN